MGSAVLPRRRRPPWPRDLGPDSSIAYVTERRVSHSPAHGHHSGIPARSGGSTHAHPPSHFLQHPHAAAGIPQTRAAQGQDSLSRSEARMDRDEDGGGAALPSYRGIYSRSLPKVRSREERAGLHHDRVSAPLDEQLLRDRGEPAASA